MSQTVTDQPLNTANFANSPGVTQISAASDTDPNFPDLRTEAVQQEADATASGAEAAAPLFPDAELTDLRSRWDNAQGLFVDEPRKAVQEADSLVANVVKQIAEQFAGERAKLEKQWDRGGDVSTEDLRQALRRYRAFFDRLLSFQ